MCSVALQQTQGEQAAPFVVSPSTRLRTGLSNHWYKLLLRLLIHCGVPNTDFTPQAGYCNSNRKGQPAESAQLIAFCYGSRVSSTTILATCLPIRTE